MFENILIYLSTYTPSKVFTYVLFLLVIWTLFWKAYALWRAGRNNQPIWFFVLFVFESIGLLPMIYLKFFQKKRK